MKPISDDGLDSLVELFFAEFPAMPAEDLARILQEVVAIIACEVLRGKKEERDVWCVPARN